MIPTARSAKKITFVETIMNIDTTAIPTATATTTTTGVTTTLKPRTVRGPTSSEEELAWLTGLLISAAVFIFLLLYFCCCQKRATGNNGDRGGQSGGTMSDAEVVEAMKVASDIPPTYSALVLR